MASKRKRERRLKHAARMLAIGRSPQIIFDTMNGCLPLADIEALSNGRPARKRSPRSTRPERTRRLSPKQFYASREWLELRYGALRLHGGRCQCCGRTRFDGVVIHVDHIKPRSKYPELELDAANLQVLCDLCNVGKSNLDETDWRAPLPPLWEPTIDDDDGPPWGTGPP